MAFEDLLRSIPLIHKHIMRTRLLMHENRLFRKFIEYSGLSVEDILSDKFPKLEIGSKALNHDAEGNEQTLHTLAESLRSEQMRAKELEADLYVLQIDYDDLLKQQELNSYETRISRNTKAD